MLLWEKLLGEVGFFYFFGVGRNIYLRLFSVLRGEFWVSVLQGEGWCFFQCWNKSSSDAVLCVCVCVMQLGVGGKILTHICVLGIHLEILDCSTSVFIKALTRFLMCNPHGYMLSVESCGFPGGCIPALPRASLGAG